MFVTVYIKLVEMGVNNHNNVFFGGIDFELDGNGGSACKGFLSIQRRLIESFIALAFSCLCIYIGYSRLALPTQSIVSRKDSGGKRVLLVIPCLVFGIEIGFKFATRSLIFNLNQCHITTAFQVTKNIFFAF